MRPPVTGTGKTTTAAKNIARAADKFGVDRVMVTSFTKAAAIEIGQRELPVPKEMCGTLHAICWRALDRPEIAETHIKEWNEKHGSYSIEDSQNDLDDPLGSSWVHHSGQQSLSHYQLLRARRVDRTAWPTSVLSFAREWEDWKEDNGYLDFTDLIDRCLLDVPMAPSAPKVMFVDEAQDLSALQFALVRKWAKYLDHIVFLGDDEQCLYDFTGADPENMIGSDLPADHKIVLNESYRLPKKIQEHAMQWSARLSRRQEKVWKPRDAEGSIERLRFGSWRYPNEIIDLAAKETDSGHSVALLASCSYMLTPMIAELRKHGIPFHNPYRKTNGAWNPVRTGDGSTFARIRAFLGYEDDLTPSWTAWQLAHWIDLLDTRSLLKHGAKAEIDALAVCAAGRRLTNDEWVQYFKSDPFGLDPPNLAWLEQHIKASKKDAAQYPLHMLKNGKDAKKPKVIVGTVHSIKGGEADTVILCPDVSREAWAEWHAGGTRRDAVIRMGYVGMTRARENLVIAQSGGPLTMPI